jgi:1-pyrroline-5-carboxylate dehydrogenase
MKPANEEVLPYLPGSREKESLKATISRMKSEVIDIPLIIDGQEVRTGNTAECVIPHNHKHVLATYHMAGPKEMEMAIESALQAKKEWEALPWEHRLAVFLKAAELIGEGWRNTLNGATMLGQSKTACEADADSACELYFSDHHAAAAGSTGGHTAAGQFLYR